LRDCASCLPTTAAHTQVWFPIWADLAANQSQVAAALASVQLPDLWTPYGMRSTSSADPRYNNDNIM
jgi:glycogen debranching enzyme